MNSRKKVPKKIVKSESESKLESNTERLAFGSNPSEVHRRPSNGLKRLNHLQMERSSRMWR
jgi:hypothetical protein